ncbi:hypothetical protein [Thermus thermamylovorans]|uniref:Uncharacterized protein n=1 Tax=Thermus thermamylovorans TaxID=2509362 RepID=A0A4Q9B4Q9_9DEIN|nr:hypothetical protein [Thermus thermamylovorans]TBH20103.1 hypothetical protein ETP66_08140 [Thermus thermamylovorans]
MVPGPLRLAALLPLALLALAQVFPSSGGRYLYSDGTVQELLPTEEGFRLRYLREGRVFREDRLKKAPEGLYLLGVGLPEGYFPFEPPLLLYPARLELGLAWGGSARFQGQRVALSARVEGVEGVRVGAGAFNAFRVRVAYTTERGGTDLQELYLVPGLGVVAYRAGGVWVGLLRRP